jgi:hypothetical protein
MQTSSVFIRFILITAIIVSIFSCSQQKCGLLNKDDNYGSISYLNICDEMIQEDTIYHKDVIWTAGTELAEMGIGFIFESDTIQFYLPDNYRIVKVMQSFKLIPSIWARGEDNVGQFITFDNLGALCSSDITEDVKDNKLANPLDISDSLTTALYFKQNKVISKQDLISEIENMPNWDSNDERETFKSYLNNYSSWTKAPREQFELIAGERFLTLYIRVGDDVKDLTFVYSPVYGN